MQEISASPVYKYSGRDIPISITYHEAKGVYKDMGLPLLNMLQNGEEVALIVMGDDETMLSIWWHIVKNELSLDEGDYDTHLKDLQNLEVFKETFWTAVINFSPKSLRPYLQMLRTELRKKLTDTKALKKQFSEYLQEQEES